MLSKGRISVQLLVLPLGQDAAESDVSGPKCSVWVFFV
jgi:hypothetical protein